ncbi:cytochrome P450 [Halorarius litoreus]|uniref:cytochrome P450 n=1 Tax=Halorarius litoreus TaxID=2962676 RepID=UPI0020CDE3DB|nr:cytochrome P450 [Halorarius litoreus]
MDTSKPGQRGAFEIPDEVADDDGQLNPYPWYDQMRERAPVRFDEERSVWDVFRYDDVERVISDYSVFSSESGATNTIDMLLNANEKTETTDTLASVDPPKHTEFRGIIDDVFRPGYLKRYQETFEAMAEGFVEEAVTGQDEIDFVEDVAWTFPVTVIAEILGVPPEDREQFKTWSDELVAAPDKRTPEAKKRAHENRVEVHQEMTDYFADIVAQRRDDPKDDLITTIIEDGEDVLTEQEIYNFGLFLLLAGNVTTRHILTNAIWTFVEQDVVDELQDGSIPMDRAVEEVLRYRTSVHVVRRQTSEAVELQGKTIPEGDFVVAHLGAANRDPRQFDEPDTFDPTRQPNTHLAFGRGPHTCLGAPVARLEATIMLSAFLDAVDTVEIATDDLEPFYGSNVYGLESLPLSIST